MNLIRGKSVFLFGTLVLAEFVFFPLPGSAQQVLRGEFSLSREVRWENSILPMGDYVYFVDSNVWPILVRVEQKGGGFSGMFIPEALLRPGMRVESRIVLGSTGKSTYVMSLHMQELGGELDFAVPGANEGERVEGPVHGHEAGFSFSSAAEYLTIINPNHEKISLEEAWKVYWRACEVVQREFNVPTPIRPRLILRLGTKDNVLRYPMLEIQLKKWDEYRFADAVVEFALRDMVPPQERVRLGNAAVHEAAATVNICELKTCRN